MNRNIFKENVNPLDSVEQIDQGKNSPTVNLDPVVHNVPKVEAVSHSVPIGTNAEVVSALLNHEESEHFRTLWNEIQGKFVDEPRSAVQQADALVSEVIEKITQMFSSEHSSLEGQWKEGNDVSTEDLRKALQHYRSFFNRLVV